MNFPTLGGNWVDLVILIVIAFFVVEASQVRPWAVFANFISFLLSLLISLAAYQFTAQILRSNFDLSHSTSNAVGFFLTAILAGGILGFVTIKVAGKIPIKYWKKWWSRVFAFIPAIGEGIILIAFVLTLLLALPFSPQVKKDITNSKIGSLLVRQTSGIEVKVDEIFGGAIENSLTYFTINPESHESIPITYDRLEFRLDEESETTMIKLINKERVDRGFSELKVREELIPVARAHAQDMWEGQYFGHLSPNGEKVGDRLNKESLKYLTAGENLALAPTVITAHDGLMSSPGHRANILDSRFKKTGVGIIENGVHGMMIVQIFTD